MAGALALALPGSLEKVAEALELEHQKDKIGRDNMLRLAKPRKPRKGEDPAQIYWHSDPARFEMLYAYCKQDVEVERDIKKHIGALSDTEQALWEFDAKINDRGIYLDINLITAAIKIAENAHEEIEAQLCEITKGAITTVNQRDRIVTWLSDNNFIVDNVQKATLQKALTQKDIPPAARKIMELRLDGAHAAANKYKSMLAWRNPDDRVRGALQYHGASTGRWSSHGIQVHNMKRPVVEDMDAAIKAVATGDLAHIKTLYPQPMSVVGDIARATLCAAPGHRFVVADFSGIEARVTAWIAGEQAEIDQWANFDHSREPADEPYLIAGLACRLPADQARPKGKTCTLAFGFAGGAGAYRKLAPDDPATDAEIDGYKDAWRRVHPATVRFWAAINTAAVKAVRNPGKVAVVNSKLSFICDDTFLRMTLPSGRWIAYPFPRLRTNDRGGCVVVYKDNSAGKWGDCRKGQGAYGGLWTENCVQAIARDIFAAAMPRLEAAGYPIVLHVHDEIVAEVPDGFGSVEEFIRIITEVPEWAAGLPLAAKGRNGPRFCKTSKPEPSPQPAPPHQPENTSEPENLDPADNLNAGEQSADSNNNKADAMDDDEVKHYSHAERPYGRSAETYDYLDANGAPYLQVTRTTTKKFWYSHWENGAWVKEAPTPKIPYRLPELIAAPKDAPIFICEGEKDAINVAGLGLIATTNPGGGIPKAWTGDLNKWFAGKQTVYLLEDNDATGRNHANEVARNLKDLVTEIRIVSFSDLPEHGDVSDWIDQGYGRDDLLALAKKGRLPSKGYNLVCAADIIARPPDYLWAGHLARGTLELLTGLPGVGKSQIQCHYTACATTGRLWPNGTNGSGTHNVIMMTAEDVLDQTLIPRLIAAGADLNRVQILKSIRRDDKDQMFLLAEDLAELENMIRDIGDVGLICLDPITAYMGGKIDSHRATDVRSVLSPLKDVAEHAGVPISAITHPAKNASQHSLDHFIGSQAYIAVARMGHSCIEETEESDGGNRILTGRALFTNPKNSIGKKMPTLAYRIAEAVISPTGNDIITSKIVWEEAVAVTADEALAANATSKRETHNPKTFLMTILANGPVLKNVIEAEATRQGFSADQLDRAKRKMGVVSYKKKGQMTGGWVWAKPQDAPPKEEME